MHDAHCPLRVVQSLQCAFAIFIGDCAVRISQLASSGGNEADRQADRAVDMQRFARLPRLVVRNLEALSPLQEMRKSDPGLQPREGRTNTKVDAVPESDVRIGIACDVETGGIVELPSVMVRRADHRDNELPRGNRLSLHLDVPRRSPEYGL